MCVYALDKDGAGFDRVLSCDVHLIAAKPAPNHVDALISQRIEEFVESLSNSNQIYDCYHAQDCISANALAILRTQGKNPSFYSHGSSY